MKKYFLGMLAVLIAVSLSVVTSAKQTKTLQSQEWFEYVPIESGGASNPNNYVYKTMQTQECFESNTELCETQALPINPSDPLVDHKPDLSSDIPWFRNCGLGKKDSRHRLSFFY